MSLVLYQFPVSHYCEKIRWALDYKKRVYPDLVYTVKNLMPGPHVSTTKKLAKKTNVPILVHNGKVVQNSSDIISYLDDVFPKNALTPSDDTLKEEALAWERYFDKEVGGHVRRCCYHILLDNPAIVIHFFTQNAAWYGPLLYRFIFPKLRDRMRDLMDINAETAAQSKVNIDEAVDKMHEHFNHHTYLVGDQFSRADLSAASLLAPLCVPEKYGVVWPEKLPDELEKTVELFAGRMQWLHRLYQQYR